eukprot:10154267-Ditylum_brightwellii.AAC.1
MKIHTAGSPRNGISGSNQAKDTTRRGTLALQTSFHTLGTHTSKVEALQQYHPPFKGAIERSH